MELKVDWARQKGINVEEYRIHSMELKGNHRVLYPRNTTIGYRIHSMELKGLSRKPLQQLLEIRNPFNGIERIIGSSPW
jgi:hypothetical protein